MPVNETDVGVANVAVDDNSISVISVVLIYRFYIHLAFYFSYLFRFQNNF